MDIAVEDRSKFTVDATPAIGGGQVFIGAGVYNGRPIPGVDYVAAGHSVPTGSGWGGAMRMMAFDANTGASIWNVTRAGATPLHVPVYWQGYLYEPEFFYMVRANATKPNSGNVALGDFGLGASTPRLSGNRTWAQWLGYQISSSAAYADDPTGPKVYIGSDIGSLYALDAATGKTLSVFTAGANIPSSPAIWDGKLYAAAVNGNVYCFDDSPVVDTKIYADSSKGTTMWNTETLTIGGRLYSTPMELVWTDDEYYLPVTSSKTPGLPNTNVIICFDRPDGSTFNLTTTTNKQGDFTVNYNPTQLGQWGWVAFYEGKSTDGLTYNSAYTEYYPLLVTSPSGEPNPTSPTATDTPTENGDTAFPMEYVYAIVAVVVIAIIAAVAYLFLKGKK